MISDDIRGLLKAEPFRPFSISYKTGKVYRVTDPAYCWVPPKNGTTSVFVADRKGSYVHLDTSWILEVSAPTSERRRRRKAG